MKNINDSYFDGTYKEIWRSLMPPPLTEKECDLMIEYCKLSEGAEVLDFMCGHGRHALALANRGFSVTAVDNLPDYIQEIQNEAEEKNLAVTAQLNNALDYQVSKEFDLIICMGNSLNFFSPEELKIITQKFSRGLKKGGYVLINSWSIAEIAYKFHTEKSWTNWGDMKLLTDSRFEKSPSRIESDTYFIQNDGTTEHKKAIDYIYSLNELDQIFRAENLVIRDSFSSFGKKPFTIGDQRIYLFAQKS